MTRRATFRESDYRRLVKFARDEGLCIALTELRPDGSIRIHHLADAANDDEAALFEKLNSQGLPGHGDHDHKA